MISVGIFTRYYPDTIDETIRKIKADGMGCVQLDVQFKDCDAAKEYLTVKRANEVRDKFRDANLPVVAVSGYANLVSPDPVKRDKNIRYIKMMMDRALDLGCPYVASETGTLNLESDWAWDDANATECAYEQLAEVVHDVVAHGREVGATFILEACASNIIGSVDQVLRLFSDVNLPNMKVICDPTNFFTPQNVSDADGQLRRIFDALADKMVVAHAKDLKPSGDAGGIEFPAPGLGILNYDLYVKLLAKYHPNIPLIIEHIGEGGIPRAKAFLDGVLKRQGV